MTVHEYTRQLLSHGAWYAPHEVLLLLKCNNIHCAAEATTARMRDLRKPQYGGHDLKKRRRAGTTYFEYRIQPVNENRNQEAA